MSIRKVLFSAVLVALLFSVPLSASGAQIQWTEEERRFISEHPEIHLGVDPSYIPYEFVDTDGVYKGITADYLQLISERTGLKFTVAPGLTWSEAYEKAVERELDALPCVSKTPERERYFLYSAPYYTFIRVIVLGDSVTDVNAFEDLLDRTVAVPADSSHESYLKQFPSIRLHTYKTTEAALAAIAEGKEEIFVGNYATSMYQIKSRGFTNLRYIKFDADTRQNLHFAVRTDWPVLISILNKSLASITREEKIAIDNKWIGVEYQTDYGKVFRILAIAAAIIAGVFLVSFYWIRKLRREISERIKAEEAMKTAKEEAEAANRIKSSFLARMSHEIRTPLNAITGMAYLIKKTEVTATQQLYVDKIVQASRTMLGIINDILDFSKIEAGKIDIETIPFNLDKVLQQVITIISFKIEEQGIEFSMNKDPKLPSNFFGDPTRIEQILLNLISNAVKFTESGTVTVDIRPADTGADRLVFQVADTGIGLSGEQMAILFEPFGQADSSINRRFGGTGLGLSIVKSLVDMMGGTIRVESELGKGSIFTVDLPLQADLVREKQEMEKATSVYFQGIRTLVVDKSETYLKLLREYLISFNMNAEFADNENEALERLAAVHQAEEPPYDLVILDYETPSSGGINFIEKVHGDSLIRTKPKFILMIPLMREDIFEKISGTKVDLGVTKPLIPSVLFNGIVELFRSKVLEAHEEMNLSEQAVRFVMDRPAHVLVVEDNKTNQFIAKSILEQAGFTVSLADNGQDGVEAFRRLAGSLDLILMDLHMPVMNGYDATEKIREADALIPIIAMTADAVAGVEEACQLAGITGYISKPFEPERLIATLVDTLKRSVDSTGNSGSQQPLHQTEEVQLDEKDGLRRLGNNQELYTLVLAEYYQENRSIMGAINAAVEAGQYPEAIQLVHKMKSSTGNIGAKPLFETASALQEALAGRNDEKVTLLLVRFEKQLSALLEHIAREIPGENTR